MTTWDFKFGINLSSNYCYSVSVSSKSSNNEKLKIKKKGQSSANVSHGNILDTINKTTFYETENAEEISILNEQNLESKNISKDLFDKKIQKIRNQTFNHSLASYISVCIHFLDYIMQLLQLLSILKTLRRIVIPLNH
ncbi:hypothetical protein Avbf_08272 [Armadillidium vulgare]|nr:hypothetical protein Avbf_08272 [Armadillidium vulgare]